MQTLKNSFWGKILSTGVVLSTIVWSFSPSFITYNKASANAGDGYSIQQDGSSPTISGNTATVFGTAAANPYKGGSVGQQEVSYAVDNGGSCSSQTWNSANITITSEGGSGNNKFFTATWTSDITFPGPGTYTVIFKVHHSTPCGAEGSDTGTITIPVTIPPTPNTPPVITELGSDPINLTVGDTYSEPGATAADTEDGDLTSSIVTTGSVDTATVGTYTITYTVTDSGGLTDTKTRTVNVASSGGGGGGGSKQCNDGIDNDGDGLIDFGNGATNDPGCDNSGDDDETNAPPPVENTLALCSDTTDNDGDGLVDLADPDCVAFTPKLTVTKVVTNDNGGTMVVADFPLFVESTGVTSGASNTFAPGTYTVSETGNASYTASFSDACDSSGSVALAIGDDKTCTITNDDIAQSGGSGGSGGGGDTSSGGGGGGSGGGTGIVNSGGTAPQTSSGGQVLGASAGPLGETINTSGGSIVTAPGQVLGAETSCAAQINSYMKIGYRGNNSSDVSKLQRFLNDHMGLNLPVSGKYGTLTANAVSAFQKKYEGDVLGPWEINKPTGITWLTTRRKINTLLCSSVVESLPNPLHTWDLK